MIGLILKDIYNLKKQSKIYLILLVFYFFMGMANRSISMFGTMLSVLAAMLPVTAMAYDEKNNWERYALTMPLSRKDMVLSRYILGLLFAFIAFIISMASSVFLSNESFVESVAVNVGTLCFVLLLMAIIFPILFKFGIEKGRILMILILFAPSMIILFLSNYGIQLPDEETIKPFLYYSPIAVIIIFILSLFLSISIYNKKEF
ncbi:ABC-2 transporter permease [Defluviitalea saccharophila]|uniref:ABC-2 transporter permease n=1 Tax=Defluviitalea saccharophila TaxID=879970 RepID=A0ABZ2YA15_9FIRM|nr:ABC-2 transporter permease [Candidatus Epulonipiscium sp.]